MKVMMANYPWIGGIADYIEKAFIDHGCEVQQYFYNEKKQVIHRYLKLNQVKYLDRKYVEKRRQIYNEKLKSTAKQIKPDVFFVFNEGYVNTETIRVIRKTYKTKTICFIGDDPFDSYRFQQLPYSLKYIDHIYIGEKCWIDKIHRIAPESKLYKMLVGYDSSQFNFERSELCRKTKIKRLDCTISFTGESYSKRAEGGYRSGILANLLKYDLKIWGDAGWRHQFQFYPDLQAAYQGERLSYDELLYVYANTLINMNMPSPQLITAFQPRVFEIAACGGFQIVDFREDLLEVFRDDEIVTFRTVPELKEKIEYFIKYPEKRKPYIEAGLRAVKGNTWHDRAAQIIANLKDEK